MQAIDYHFLPMLGYLNLHRNQHRSLAKNGGIQIDQMKFYQLRNHLREAGSFKYSHVSNMVNVPENGDQNQAHLGMYDKK